jgi:hypothetical protein
MMSDTTHVNLRCSVKPILLQSIVLALVIGALVPAAVLCQTSNTASDPKQNDPGDSTSGIRGHANEWGVWGGISFHSPTLIGKTPDARFGNIALRYGRVLVSNESVAFQWTIDAVPLSILSVKRFTFTQTSPGTFTLTSTRDSSYGAGVSPIGFKFNFRPQRRVQPFAQTTGGFLFFNEDVPVPGAARFNFTFDFSGGIQVVNSSRRAWMLGYKYQHISNGYHSPINPGVDLQMIFAGFSIFR